MRTATVDRIATSVSPREGAFLLAVALIYGGAAWRWLV